MKIMKCPIFQLISWRKCLFTPHYFVIERKKQAIGQEKVANSSASTCFSSAKNCSFSNFACLISLFLYLVHIRQRWLERESFFSAMLRDRVLDRRRSAVKIYECFVDLCLTSDELERRKKKNVLLIREWLSVEIFWECFKGIVHKTCLQTNLHYGKVLRYFNQKVVGDKMIKIIKSVFWTRSRKLTKKWKKNYWVSTNYALLED